MPENTLQTACTHSFPRLHVLPCLFLLTNLTHAAIFPSRPPPGHILTDGSKYVTRPDIEAPRWHVHVYDKDQISSGYWFVETYDYLDQSRNPGGLWNAPHIFDGSGELIWSGSYLSRKHDSFDFRVSNVLGENMITWLYPQNRSAVIMDNSFEIRRTFSASDYRTEIDNMHDLQFVDGGKRALYFYDEYKWLSKEQSHAIGFTDGQCRIHENSFRERDMTTDEVVFTWLASEHLDIRESTFGAVEWNCKNAGEGYDFLHANSIDKFPDDGSYLLSGRHTDAIYKIAPNGTIVWRLGGTKSDFEADFQFIRQHHARIHEHNSTHTVITLFDNAKAEDTVKPVSSYSRGIKFVLHTSVQPMKATLLVEYPHPKGGGWYTLGRGSTQVLPNGNIFQCWVDNCLHSEHTPDGKLVMEAQVNQEWLKSYRSYKFDFVGRPHDPPDVVSTGEVDGKKVKTVVHTSWNGATEVASWHLFKTDPSGKHRKHLAQEPRTSFETKLEYHGYAKYVQIDAVDRNRKFIGRSKVIETRVPALLPQNAVEEEDEWLTDQANRISWLAKAEAAAENPIAVAVFWGFVAAVIVFVLRFAWLARHKHSRWWSRKQQSHELNDVAVEGEDESLVSDHEKDKYDE